MARGSFKARLLLGAVACGVIPVPAMAQDAADNGANSGEIIVTARRVEESIEDVPISITVLSQDALTKNNITSAADLANFAPNLSANQKFGTDNTTFSIRGFFQELRTSASVGVYFADVIAPRGPASTAAGDGAGPGDFFDLQNVQVLKGPQGTLFGRNTTGGAVLLVPQKPTDKFEGYVEGSYGSHDMRRLQGVINVPISDTIRFRAGVDWQKRDGYLTNRSTIGPRDFANTDYIAARASLSIDLTPDLENYTIATYARSKARGFIGRLEEALPGVFPLGQVAASELARQQAAGYDKYDVFNRLSDAGAELEIWRIINTTTWTVNDAITLKNIASYSTLRNDVRSNFFGDSFPLGPTFINQSGVTVPTGVYQGQFLPFARLHSIPGGDMTDQATFTEEFRAQGITGALDWQAGIYYEKSTPRAWSGTFGYGQLVCDEPLEALRCTDVVRIFNGAATPTAAANIEYNQKKTSFENVGVYAQGTLKLTDWLDFTGGIRYTWDKSNSEFYRYLVNFPSPNTPNVYCNDALPSPAGLTFAQAQARTGCGATAGVKMSAPTWTTSLEMRPNDNVMTFVKYSRGYRQGGTNPDSLPGFKTFRDEKVDVYEAGLRLSDRVFGRPAYANVTGFYNDFTDQQVQAGAFVLGTAPNAVVLNAGASTMSGFEVEAGISPFEALKLNVGYGYLHTKLRSFAFPGVPLPAGSPPLRFPFVSYDLQTNGPGTGPFIFPTSTPGTDLPLSPHHTLVVSGELRLPLPEEVGEVSIGATYSYTSKQVFSFSNFPRGAFDERNIVNANLTWKGVAGSPVDVSVFATNLFDERYIVLANDQTSSGFITRNYGEPQMYGLRVRYNFGGD